MPAAAPPPRPSVPRAAALRSAHAFWLAPQAADPAVRRRERAVRACLAGALAICVFGIAAIASTTLAGQHTVVSGIARILVGGMWIAVCLRLHRAVRGGRVQAAALGLLGMWSCATIGCAVAWSILLPATFLMVTLFVVMAVLLLEGRVLIAALASLAAVLTAVELLRLAGLLVPEMSLESQTFGIVDELLMVVGLAVVAGVVLAVRRPAIAPATLAVAPPETAGQPAPVRERTGALTSRETEVTALVAQGLSNDQIAARLVVSPRTVHTHVASALRKTGCANRTALGVLAVREGLLADCIDGEATAHA